MKSQVYNMCLKIHSTGAEEKTFRLKSLIVLRKHTNIAACDINASPSFTGIASFPWLLGIIDFYNNVIISHQFLA
uniref:Putative ovule protein n=1 Tax=Solanum chacoense TaxID=4108 RepID=A0A0V0GSY4_SOLCH